MGYIRVGRQRETCWQQTADRKQLRDMLEEILAAEKPRQRESRRRGEGTEWEEVAEYELDSEGYRYTGKETGDAQVGGWSCVGTKRLVMERERRKDQSAPLGKHLAADWNDKVVLISIATKNYQWNLGPKSSLYELGLSPPHNSDTPNGLVSSKTTTTTRIGVSNLKG